MAFPSKKIKKLKRDARSGVTLVELLVSVLLLTIIFCGWMAMNNIQAVRKESFRYEAVEKAEGLLDSITVLYWSDPDNWYDSALVVNQASGHLEPVRPGKSDLFPLWPDSENPIGCTIHIQELDDFGGVWAKVALYDSYIKSPSLQSPFATLRLLLEAPY